MQYRTGEYQSMHTENPASPYYTPDGAQEAGYSDLDPGGAHSPLQAIDLWLEAPFHAVGMLRSQLTQVALADDPSKGFAGLDVIQGLDYNLARAITPILFPGPGITTNLVAFEGESPDPLQTCGWPDGPTVGLPLVALLPQAPAESLAATLTGPSGTQSTSNGRLCLVDQYTYHSSDPVYGPTGASILQGDNAAFLIPHQPLTTGTYSVNIQQTGVPTIGWSFAAVAPIVRTSIERLTVHGHLISVHIAAPSGTNLRCALSPRVGREFETNRFSKCWQTTLYRHVRRGTYRFTVRSHWGSQSRLIHVS